MLRTITNTTTDHRKMVQDCDYHRSKPYAKVPVTNTAGQQRKCQLQQHVICTSISEVFPTPTPPVTSTGRWYDNSTCVQ